MSVPRDRAGKEGVEGDPPEVFLELAGRRGELLRWYDSVGRDLPWRRLGSEDPQRRVWGIWLSEVMSQQTRVEVVVPYWERFLERYPSPADLARAGEEEVLAEWSGLGYYRRARQLHRAAREVAAAGGIPRTARELRELPGFGPYTAAAVASIAFGEPVAVVDGNVERLVSRLLELDEDPRRARGRRMVREGAQALLDPERPGDSNQAMMELGSRICRPRSPRCAECVLAPVCRARRAGRQEELPRARRRREAVRILRQVAVVGGPRGVLLVRREEEAAVMAGFWELPGVVGVPGNGDLEAIEAELRERFGGTWELGPETLRVDHAITHRRITLCAHPARIVGGGEVREGVVAAWVDPGSSGERPIGAATRRVLDAVAAARAQDPDGASRD